MKIAFVTNILERVAPRIGATLFIEPEYRFVGHIKFKNGKKAFFKGTNFNINKLGAIEIVKDKAYTSFFLKKFGYKVPEGMAFFNDNINKNIEHKRNINDGYLYAKEIGFPVIVKPNAKSQGFLVAKVYNRREYYRIAKEILKTCPVFLIERYYGGYSDYRIVVLDNEIISVYQRIPLSVVGDGHSTILDLIREKQKEFIRIGRYERINVTDLRITSILKRNNFDLNSILEKEQVLSLLDNANLSTGGKAIDYTNEIHPRFKDLAINATRDMDLRLCGVDILTNDIKEWSDDYIILELNGAPGLDNYASIGVEQQLIVDNLYLKILKAIENS